MKKKHLMAFSERPLSLLASTSSQNIASNHGDICGGDVGVGEPGKN